MVRGFLLSSSNKKVFIDRVQDYWFLFIIDSSRKFLEDWESKMSRKSTGISKKSNRENSAAFDLVLQWRMFGAKGFVLSPELAWAVSGGKFGTEPVMLSAMPLEYAPDSEATIDAMKVALYIVRKVGA